MTFPRLHPTQQDKSVARYDQPIICLAQKVVVSQPCLLCVRVSPRRYQATVNLSW